MLIRSQDKRAICNLDNIDSIAIEENTIYSFNGISDTRCDMGTYSTEEKAIKVLDMIQANYERRWEVFQMPQDSEV